MGMVIPPFYEGDHGNDHLPCLPSANPFPLSSVPHAYRWWDPILSTKTLHTLLELNQTSKLTLFPHFPKGFRREINEFKMKAEKVLRRLTGLKEGPQTRF